jgi:hypothetical protein
MLTQLPDETITFGVSFLELFRKVPPLVARGGTFLKSSKFDGWFQNHVVAKGKKDVGSHHHTQWPSCCCISTIYFIQAPN